MSITSAGTIKQWMISGATAARMSGILSQWALFPQVNTVCVQSRPLTRKYHCVKTELIHGGGLTATELNDLFFHAS